MVNSNACHPMPMHPEEPQPACIVLEGLEFLPALQALARGRSFRQRKPKKQPLSKRLPSVCRHGTTHAAFSQFFLPMRPI